MANVQLIPGDRAFLLDDVRYDIKDETADDTRVADIMNAFAAKTADERKASGDVYRLDVEQGRFQFKGEWFEAKQVKGASRTALTNAEVLDETARAFIAGLGANDISTVSRATFSLKATGEHKLKYFRSGGAADSVQSWSHDLGERFTKIRSQLKTTRAHLDVKSSYTMQGSSNTVDGIHGFKNNTKTTCFAGSILVELRRMENKFPIHEKMTEGIVPQADVNTLVTDRGMDPTRQQDAAEFRQRLLANADFRLPVDIFAHYRQLSADRLAMLEPKGTDSEQQANVRAALHAIFNADEPTTEQIQAFVEANKALPAFEDEDLVDLYTQQMDVAFDSVHIPLWQSAWDTADHLSFALVQLGLYSPEDADLPFAAPYAQLGQLHLQRELQPVKIHSPNTLEEMVASSGLKRELELAEALKIPLPEFIPLEIRRFDAQQRKTFHKVQLTESMMIGDEMYELVGLTRHLGGTPKSGHYIGYTRLDEDRWAEFNDDKARERTLADIQRDAGATVRTVLLRRVPTDV